MAKYILFREKNNLPKLTSKEIIKIQGDSKNQILKVQMDGSQDEQMQIEAKSKCKKSNKTSYGQLYDYIKIC